MRKQIRPAEPQWLKDNAQKWTEEWISKKSSNPKFQFSWKTLNKEIVSHTLLRILLDEMTAKHCSFCDIAPLITVGATVEHFKPKTPFPEEVYLWSNLFPCCTNCQKKGDRYNALLLKPDEENYDFFDFFNYNYSTGFISPNVRQDEHNQQRAKITIELYGLNDYERPEARVYAMELLDTIPHEQRLKHSYSFLFDF